MTRRPTTLLICAAVAALFALPAASASGATLVGTLAADACAAEKADLGKKAFKKRYGAKKPMKACIKRAKPQARAAVDEATDECLWELEEYGDEEFYAEWGTFSACVEDYAAWIMDGGGFEDEEDEGGEEEEEEGLEGPL